LPPETARKLAAPHPPAAAQRGPSLSRWARGFGSAGFGTKLAQEALCRPGFFGDAALCLATKRAPRRLDEVERAVVEGVEAGAMAIEITVVPASSLLNMLIIESGRVVERRRSPRP